MTIIADEKLDFIWTHPVPGGDYLGALRTLDDGKAELVYRFRYYKDDKLFDESKDEKRWYRMVTTERARLLEYQRHLLREAGELFGVKVHEVARKEPGPAGTQAMMDELTALPGFHTKTVGLH